MTEQTAKVLSPDGRVSPDEKLVQQVQSGLASRIIDSISESIVATDFDGNILYWNTAAEQMYGWTTDEVMGQNVFTLMGSEEVRNRTVSALEVMRDRESWSRDLEVLRKDGSSFPAQVTLTQVRDDQGEVIGVVGLTSDVTVRKRTEMRLAIQYAVSRILSEASDLEGAGEQLLQAICSHLEWDWCALWTVDESAGVLHCVAIWHSDDQRFSAFGQATRELTFPPGIGLPGRTWAGGEPEWIVDYGNDPNFVSRTPLLETGIQSAMAVPMRLGSREVRGVIEFMSQARIQRDDELVDMVSAAARQMGLFLERQQANQALREHEARLRRLEESNLIGIIRANLDGSISDANDAFLNMIGYSREDLEAGLRWDELTPEEWRGVDAEIINDILTTGTSPQKEKEYFRKDGSRLPLLIGSAQLQPGSTDVVTFVIDISARRQAEREREESFLREQAARIQAGDAQRKAEQLLGVTAAFSRARTPNEVARVAIHEGISILGASAGAFTLLNDERDMLELMESHGYLPEAMQRWRENPISLHSGYPLTECIARGESIWVGSRQELFERFPAMKSIDYPFSASIVALPLVVNGQPIGAINLGFSEEHEFTDSERVFVETLVQFCSQALERSWLFSTEQEARQRARDAQYRAERLNEVTAALSRALTPREVAEVTIEQGLTALGVAGGMVALLREDGANLDVIHSSGYAPETVDLWREEPIPLGRPVPLADAARTGEPIWIYSRQELFDRYPLMAERTALLSEAFAALPMMSGNQIYGVLGLSYSSPHQMDQAERIYARTLARLSSQALERASLFSLERDARVSAEAAQRRLALLAESGELLNSSLDTYTTLASIAQLIVPQLADWCAVDVVDDSSVPDRVAVMHVDPEKIRWAEDLQRRYPHDPYAPAGVANVLRTGKSEFYPTIPDELIAAAARDEEHLEIIRAVGFSSAMIVPMVAHGRTVGAITLVYAESGRHYTEADLTLVEDVAYRAALAVDNARLYEQAQQHAARMDAIAEASRSFAEASLDRAAVLETLSRQVASSTEDWAVIRLTSEDRQWLEPVSIFHPDPEAEDALREMFNLAPMRWGEGMTGQVASTGESLLVSEISPEAMQRRVKPEHRHWLERYSIYAALIVPMRLRHEVIGTIALFRDDPGRPFTEQDRQLVQEIADRAALAVENARLFHQAQEAVRLREEFLSIASHEMRTPLTTITGFAHLLNRQATRGQMDEDRIGSISSRLLSEARRLDQLVGDLLDVSRIQQGRLDIRPEPCDLSQIVQDVASRLRDAQEPGVEREIVVAADDAVTGHWDPARIDQVVTNLLSNALKYSPDGEITLTVSLDEGDTAVLAVRDQGIGIPLEDLARLFEPFVRGDDAHHTSSGTGLGLYITRQIVEHHSGGIELESAPGEGTTFVVRLPLQPAYESAL